MKKENSNKNYYYQKMFSNAFRYSAIVVLLFIFGLVDVKGQVNTIDDPGIITSAGRISFAELETIENNRPTVLYVQYTTNSQNGNNRFLDIGDDVDIEFPAGFTIPATIPTSGITFDGSDVQGVQVNGNTVTVQTPNTYDGTTINLRILESAGILNPNVEDDYTLVVSMEGSCGPCNFTSGSVTTFIEVEPTQVTSAAITPSSSIADLRSRYRIEFSLGDLGAMPSGSEIIIDFDAATGIPNGGMQGVTLNGTPVNQSSVVGDGTSIISITTPIALSNNEAISLEFTRGAGIRNPALPGSYTAFISTTAEPDPVESSPISYSDPENLSFSAIEITDSRVNATSGYEIEFITGSVSSLFANSDKIVFQFPDNTFVPSVINPNRINITTSDGFSDKPATVSTSGREVQLTIPFDLPGGSEVVVNIEPQAGLQNPSQTINPEPGLDNYTLQAFTINVDDEIVDAETPSNPYTISASNSTISAVETVLSDYNTNQNNVTYTTTFQTGPRGRIEGDFSTITMRFPAGTTLPANLNDLTILVQGQESLNIEESGSTGREIVFDVPSGVLINNDQNVTVSIAGVTNAGDTASKNMNVRTSAEPDFVTSNAFELGAGTFTVNSLTVGNNMVNSTGVQFEFTLNNNFNLGANSGSVFIRFPAGTTIPAGIGTGDFTVAPGTANNIDNVNIIDSRTIQVDIRRNGQQNGTFGGMTIATTAGIGHPSIPGDYNISVWTSNQPNQIPSPDYTLVSRNDNVSGVSASALPAVQGFEGAQYTISFTTSALGRLRGGTSNGSNIIELQFPAEFSLPANISNTEVLVNNATSSSVSVDGGVITVGVPAGLTINNNSEVSVRIEEGAGLINPDADNSDPENPSPRDYNIGVRTNVDAGSFVNGIVTIDPAAQLTITSLNISKLGTNDVAAYTIRFLSGSEDVVSSPPDGEINLIFDDQVYIPSTIPTTRITINGQQANAVDVNGQTITITVPQELPALEEHQINISSQAGIINPYDPGTYTISLFLPEPNSGDESDTYNITSAFSTISQPSVSVANTNENQDSNYGISFNTGANGRLESGSSQIIIEFDPVIDISGANNFRVNSQAVTQPASPINGNTLTLTVPDNVFIGNNTLVNIQIDDIGNPGPGPYTVDVNTTIETTVTTSAPFFIGASGIEIEESSLTLLGQFSPAPGQVYVNTPPNFEIEFTTANTLETSDQILIRLPEDSQIGSNANSEISIDTGDDILTFSQIIPISNQDRSNRILRFNVGTQINPDLVPFTLTFTALAGITNPREPTEDASARYEMTTTQDPNTFARSDAFQLLSVPGSISQVTLNEVRTREYNTFGEAARVDFDIIVGEYGALKNGEARVFLQFADFMTLPPSIATSNVDIEGDSPVSVNINGNIVSLVIPSGITVLKNEELKIIFPKTAGIIINDPANFSVSSSSTGNDQVMNEVLNEGGTFAAASSAESEFSEADNVSLPVELIEFSVAARHSSSSNSVPELFWSTATEKENYGFDVYRSFDNTEDWKHLSFIEGAGTTQQKQEYRYTDNSVQLAGVYFYKIVQMDYDGTTEEFGPVEFLYQAPESFSLTQNYPNPFNPVTTIPFTVPTASDVQLNVYDILGRRVRVLVNEQMQPGQYNIQFDASQLASGTYFIRMVADGQVFTRKMMLIK